MIFFMALIDEKNDYEKFETIYINYYKFALSICNNILKDIQYAEDATQNCFISLALCIKKVEEPISNKTKNLIGIMAKYKAIDVYRQNKKLPLPIDFESIYELKCNSYMDSDIVITENVKNIIRCLNNLPPMYLEIMELYVYYDLSRMEISKITNLNYNTVKIRIQKARKLLKKEMENIN